MNNRAEYSRWNLVSSLSDEQKLVSYLSELSGKTRDVFDLVFTGMIEVKNSKNDFGFIGISDYTENGYDREILYTGNDLNDFHLACARKTPKSNQYITFEKDGENSGLRFSTFIQTAVDEKTTHLFAEDWQLATNPDTSEFSLYRANY